MVSRNLCSPNKSQIGSSSYAYELSRKSTFTSMEKSGQFTGIRTSRNLKGLKQERLKSVKQSENLLHKHQHKLPNMESKHKVGSQYLAHASPLPQKMKRSTTKSSKNTTKSDIQIQGDILHAKKNKKSTTQKNADENHIKTNKIGKCNLKQNVVLLKENVMNQWRDDNNISYVFVEKKARSSKFSSKLPKQTPLCEASELSPTDCLSNVRNVTAQCSFKFAVYQNENVRNQIRPKFPCLPKIIENVDQESKQSSSESVAFPEIQNEIDDCSKVHKELVQYGDAISAKRTEKYNDLFKFELAAIMQNDKKIDLLEKQLKELSHDSGKCSKNYVTKDDNPVDNSLEKGISDIHVGLYELNNVLRHIEEANPHCDSKKRFNIDHQEIKEIKSTISLTNITQVSSSASTLLPKEEQVETSSKVSLPNNQIVELTQIEELKDFYEDEGKRWGTASRGRENFESKLKSQVAVVIEKEENITKLQDKLKQMAEELQNTCKERTEFVIHSKQLFSVYEKKLKELYEYCKMAQREMKCLKTSRETLLMSLNGQVDFQNDAEDMKEAYHLVLEEKETLKTEMRSLIEFVLEQGKSMEDLRQTVKQMTEQLGDITDEIGEQNEKISSYYGSSFNELNSDCKAVQSKILCPEESEDESQIFSSSCGYEILESLP